MAKAPKQAPRSSRPNESPALTKRYRSMLEIKRDFFPNAAAKEAHTDHGSREYENLMDEFFGAGRRP